jgi:hypothetical protein
VSKKKHRAIVKVVPPKSVDGKFILSAKLGTLGLEYEPADDSLWVGTNGFDEPGAYGTLADLQKLLMTLEQRGVKGK